MQARNKPKLTKINTDTTPPNDGITLKGAFLLPSTTSFANLDPSTNGARLVVLSTSGDVRVDETLPGGAYAGSGTRGWATNGAGTTWQYGDATDSPLNGIIKVIVQDKSASAPQQVKFAITGNNGSYPVVAGDEPLTAIVVLGGQSGSDAGECTESDLQPGGCQRNGAGNSLGGTQ